MKLIIQIPCYNEAETLPVVLKELPRSLPGVDLVEWLVVDDGSADNTAELAKSLGVDHVVKHRANLGLARAFMTGLETCLAKGADIIVNTDADNQYSAGSIPDLIAPIIEGRAEIVVGTRPISGISHFSAVKKILQRLGSAAVRIVSGTKIEDAPSGFRAFSRNAAMQLNVFSEYTYTLETIIQAGHKNIPLLSVPVETNPQLRPSRLMKSMPQYIRRSMGVILRIFVTYRPFRFFMWLGVLPFTVGTMIGLRFVFYYAQGQGGGKIQSLILAALLLGSGLLLWALAFLADLISVNRKLLEKIDWRLGRLEDRLKGGDI